MTADDEHDAAYMLLLWYLPDMHNFDKTLPQGRRHRAAFIYVLATKPGVSMWNCAGNLAKRWLRPTALFLGTLTAAVLVASLSGTSVRVFAILSLAQIAFKSLLHLAILVFSFPSHLAILLVLTHFLEDLRALIAPSFSVQSPV